jgi:hypothetical protein
MQKDRMPKAAEMPRQGLSNIRVPFVMDNQDPRHGLTPPPPPPFCQDRVDQGQFKQGRMLVR